MRRKVSSLYTMPPGLFWDDALAKLDALAGASGLDRAGVIAHLLDATQPLALAEVLAPIHDDFRRSGMTEAELDELLASELKAHREGR